MAAGDQCRAIGDLGPVMGDQRWDLQGPMHAPLHAKFASRAMSRCATPINCCCKEHRCTRHQASSSHSTAAAPRRHTGAAVVAQRCALPCATETPLSDGYRVSLPSSFLFCLHNNTSARARHNVAQPSGSHSFTRRQRQQYQHHHSPLRLANHREQAAQQGPSPPGLAEAAGCVWQLLARFRERSCGLQGRPPLAAGCAPSATNILHEAGGGGTACAKGGPVAASRQPQVTVILLS